MRRRLLVTTVLSALLLGAGSASANVRYVVVDLGVGAYPKAINASGQVVGQGPVRDLWMTGPNGTNKRSLPLPEGTWSTDAIGISDIGQLVFGVVIGDGRYGARAYLITGANGANPTNIATLYGSGVSPTGITSNGRLFGYVGGRTAFVTQPNAGSFITVGTLDGEGYTYAQGANASGQVTGYGASAAPDRYFITAPNGANLQALAAGRGFAINDNGKIAGEANSRAFVTGPGGAGRSDLGVCLSSDGPNPIQFIRSEAKAINGSGVVVGNCNTGGGPTRAAVTGDEGFMELTDLVDTPGWVITHAVGINDLGLIIGVGLYNNEVHGVLLQPQ